jgi:hypothetical protein
VLRAGELPSSIAQVPDEATQWAIQCEQSGKLFKITSQELAFYLRQQLLVPRLCPDQRHLGRMKLRNLPALWKRECMCTREHAHHVGTQCTNEFMTSYEPADKREIICEKCFEEVRE